MKLFGIRWSTMGSMLLLLAALVLAEGCKSSQPRSRKPRTIKKGKPIPCPLKDC